MTCIGCDQCCPVGPWIKNMTPRVSLTCSKSIGQSSFGWPDCNTVPSFPKSVQLRGFLPGLSATCVVILWKVSAVPLRSLIPERGLTDSKQTGVYVHACQAALKETLEHLLPIDPDGFHLENISPRTDSAIGFPCLDQSDRLTGRATRGTI